MRRKSRTRSEKWSWRLVGVVLCAFFALGLLAGLSSSARTAAWRSRAMLGAYRSLWPGLLRWGPQRLGGGHEWPSAAGPVALVERKDGFYALSAEGGLRGPISPDAEGDLPVLSGSALAGAGAGRLLDYAALLVRAEAALSALVSEMTVGGDGLASLYLQQSRTEVTIDLRDAALELERAGRLLYLWREHMGAVAALDMTTPGEAVLRLRAQSGAATFLRSAGGASAPRPSTRKAPARAGATRASAQPPRRAIGAAGRGKDREEPRIAQAPAGQRGRAVR